MKAALFYGLMWGLIVIGTVFLILASGLDAPLLGVSTLACWWLGYASYRKAENETTRRYYHVRRHEWRG